MGKLSVESFMRLAWYNIDQVIQYLVPTYLPLSTLYHFNNIHTSSPLPNSMHLLLFSQHWSFISNKFHKSVSTICRKKKNSLLSGYDLYRCGATTVLFLFFSHKTTIHIQQMQGLWQSSLLISLLFMVIFKKKSCLVFSSSFYTV